MNSILIAYASTDGQTRRIGERLQHIMALQGHTVMLLPLAQADTLDLGGFDKLVIGASIRYGHHQPLVRRFIQRHQALLAQKPSAFFSVNIVARKPDKNQPDTNPYVRKFLRVIPWKPRLVAVFAGKLDYPRYGFLDRLMIRLIMRLTHGPTDPKVVIEFTDWAAVDDFGRHVGEL